MERKIKIGLLGVGRGHVLWEYCRDSDHAELVAVCDGHAESLEKAKKQINDDRITYYSDYETFIQHDMDAVYLANYATEHAPFAIKAMESGKDVISEVLPCQTMAQAVALMECVEKTGRKYCYAENYCYMNGPMEIKRRYLAGDLGEFEYAEGEYMHNCEPGWPSLTRCSPDHWRNNIHAFFYCTHSMGPLIHISGQRPVKVFGMEGIHNARAMRMGAKSGHMGVELVTMENGAICKSIHGLGPSKNSIWYSVYGSKGRMETAREDVTQEFATAINTVYANLDQVEGEWDGGPNDITRYNPLDDVARKGLSFGHGGSDYVTIWNAIEHFLGNPKADIVDVYEAVDMWMVGFFAYQSVLQGGVLLDIPDMRDPAVREQYRNDNRCTDPAVAGDQLLPSYSKGNPEIDPQVYEELKKVWVDEHYE